MRGQGGQKEAEYEVTSGRWGTEESKYGEKILIDSQTESETSHVVSEATFESTGGSIQDPYGGQK